MITCDTCKKVVSVDEIADFENGICEPCHDKWCAEQMAYWRPLYEGEKRAGLLQREES